MTWIDADNRQQFVIQTRITHKTISTLKLEKKKTESMILMKITAFSQNTVLTLTVFLQIHWLRCITPESTELTKEMFYKVCGKKTTF